MDHAYEQIMFVYIPSSSVWTVKVSVGGPDPIVTAVIVH